MSAEHREGDECGTNRGSRYGKILTELCTRLLQTHGGGSQQQRYRNRNTALSRRAGGLQRDGIAVTPRKAEQGGFLQGGEGIGRKVPGPHTTPTQGTSQASRLSVASYCLGKCTHRNTIALRMLSNSPAGMACIALDDSSSCSRRGAPANSPAGSDTTPL